MTLLGDTLVSSPLLSEIPDGAIHRIIDDGMLHYEASVAGFKERYRRGETSHTVQVWWARRPHAAMRALVFAALAKKRTSEAFQIMANLASCEIPSQSLLEKALRFTNENDLAPKVLDIFGGGGTIAAEAARLGAKAYSCDINELASYIQKTNLIYSQTLETKKLQILVRQAGEQVLKRLHARTREFYPSLKKNPPQSKSLFENDDNYPIAFLWSYSRKCTKCGYKFSLIKRPWISKKRQEKIAFMLIDNFKKNEQQVTIIKTNDQYEFKSNWLGRNGTCVCPKCETRYDENKIYDLKDELIGVITKKTKGKEFYVPSDCHYVLSENHLKEKAKHNLEEFGFSLPDTILPNWSGIVNPSLYGIEKHTNLLNERQRLTLLILINELVDQYKTLKSNHNEEIGRSVIAFLTGFIDQFVDWNCRLSMWISQNEQVGRALCGPGLPMYWDYAEIDPTGSGPANLWDKLERICKGIQSIDKFNYIPTVRQAAAQQLPFGNNEFDAIITDPPYYDNIYYSILADCIYPWKQLLLSSIEPELFKTKATTATHELVASTFRSGTPQKAHSDYCVQLKKAIAEAQRVLKNDGIFCFIYSHSSFQGWEALIQAFRPTNFIITSVQPLSIERKERPRAMTSVAVNTCLSFVAHKSGLSKSEILINELLDRVRSFCNGFSDSLLSSGWDDNDVALAIFANGVGLAANHERTLNSDAELTDLEIMEEIQKVIQQTFPEFKMQKRQSL